MASKRTWGTSYKHKGSRPIRQKAATGCLVSLFILPFTILTKVMKSIL